MIGGTILSFYDWYADMPIASPQVFGDRCTGLRGWGKCSYLMIYRTAVAPWFRGLLTGRPDVLASATAALIYQVHATAAWAIFLVWPFNRLVHAWSYPLWFLWRPYIVYRSRVPVPPTEPGTSGRRWRKIGGPY